MALFRNNRAAVDVSSDGGSSCMGSYQFVFEISGRKVGTCSAISGLEEVGHKVQPSQVKFGHKVQPPQPAASLLLPAVQKVRAASGRRAIKLGHKLNAGGRDASSGSPPGTRVVPSQMKVLGNVPSSVHKLSASAPAGAPLMLQGFQPEPGAMNWVAEQGQRPQPRSGILSLRDERNRTVAQWTFTNAWPSKVSGPQPKSDSNEVGMEELTLAFEGLQRTL